MMARGQQRQQTSVVSWLCSMCDAVALLWVSCFLLCAVTTSALSATHHPTHHQDHSNNAYLPVVERRDLFKKCSVVAAASTIDIPANAAIDNKEEKATTPTKKTKSRTVGYDVQKTKDEWSNQLSPLQYNVLRRGGTERQKSSILNTYDNNNEGIYSCAGCGTALFSSADKFSSNTGWPSFAAPLLATTISEDDGTRRTIFSSVEIVVSADNGDEEVRCATCGGHLGDLFKDGWRFVGTPAAKTGKRYCINGASLVFQPSNGGPLVRGDQPPPAKVIQYEQTMYRTS